MRRRMPFSVGWSCGAECERSIAGGRSLYFLYSFRNRGHRHAIRRPTGGVRPRDRCRAAHRVRGQPSVGLTGAGSGPTPLRRPPRSWPDRHDQACLASSSPAAPRREPWTTSSPPGQPRRALCRGGQIMLATGISWPVAGRTTTGRACGAGVRSNHRTRAPLARAKRGMVRAACHRREYVVRVTAADPRRTARRPDPSTRGGQPHGPDGRLHRRPRPRTRGLPHCGSTRAAGWKVNLGGAPSVAASHLRPERRVQLGAACRTPAILRRRGAEPRRTTW
jgi:hypothetical protein